MSTIRLQPRDVSRNGVTTAIVDAFAGDSGKPFFTSRVTADLEMSRRKYAIGAARKHLGKGASVDVIEEQAATLDGQLLTLLTMDIPAEPDPILSPTGKPKKMPFVPDDDKVVPYPEPMRLAERYIQATARTPGILGLDKLRRWSRQWYRFDTAGYALVDPEKHIASLYQFVDTLWTPIRDRETGEPTGRFRKIEAKATIIREVDQALPSCGLLVTGKLPQWIDGRRSPDPAQLLVARNGIFTLADGAIVSTPTPLLFTTNCLDFDFDPQVPEPVEWLRFLDMLWPDDREAIQCLQEWCGYCLTPDTKQQKALLVVGPKRAGKGTIARVLTRLIGPANVCGPTLSGLPTNFGLWSLIGKSLAIISDARLGGRADQAVITERILAIVGEDAITIDRKNLEPVTERLFSRLMILTNELPKLNDASGALASRFMILTLTESFYGKEDTGLEDRICKEMPGILLWAIEGWKRLRDRGHFIQPATSADAIEELNDLASPIGAFVRDCCQVRPGLFIHTADLFDGWRAWCKEQGRQQPARKKCSDATSEPQSPESRQDNDA